MNKENPKLDELISLRQASKICGLTTNHLRLLLGKDLLWGKKIDSFWVTTEAAIREYQSMGKRPGPKSKNN
jgi:hypothetical protein